MKVIVFIFLLAGLANSVTLVELFGLENLLVNLTSSVPADPSMGDQTIYSANPQIQTYLKKFKTRLAFCEEKCRTIYNFPCFLLFQCNIHIRNFFILVFFPIFILSLTGLCCGKGVWTFACWMKYIARFSCIQGIVLVFRYLKNYILSKCKSENDGTEQKSKEQTQLKAKKEYADKINDSQAPQTTDRIRTQKHHRRRRQYRSRRDRDKSKA